jgi:hypothetical protein
LVTILSSLLSVFLAIPLLGFILVFGICKLMKKSTRNSMRLALDLTTVLFILAVHFLLIAICGKSYLWLIIVIMMLIAMAFTTIHWKIRREVVVSRVLKGIWRFNFLFFLLVYIALTFYGMIERAITYTL